MALDETETLSLGRLDGLLGFHLRMASAAIARDFAATLEDLGLTQKQCAVLELIAANPQVSQIDMAATLGMDRATMMAVVDRLDGARFAGAHGVTARPAAAGANAIGDGRSVCCATHAALIAQHEKRFLDRLGPMRTETADAAFCPLIYG